MVDNNDMKNDYDDNIQHGIDDSPSGDAEKGAALGGLGGAVVGGIAGSAVGPVGTVVGAVVGGVVGAAGSGVAVAAVDKADNDNNMTGLGSEIQYESDSDLTADNTTAASIPSDYPAQNWEANTPPSTNYNNPTDAGAYTADTTDESRGASMHADYTREQGENLEKMDCEEDDVTNYDDTNRPS